MNLPKEEKGINVLSLFDGMSCGRIALDRLGIKVNRYLASEVDRDAIKVSKANWPDIEHIGDVRKVKAVKLPKIDVIIAGSPCQGFSFAGRQLNFDDPRSALFFEFVRIYKEIKAVNPQVYFLLENVQMRKDIKDEISRIVGVAPVKLNSASVSAQNRVRLYWTDIPMAEYLPDLLDDCGADMVLQDVLENGFVDRDKAFCLDANYWKGGNLKRYFVKHSRQLVFCEDGSFRNLTPLECERLQTLPEGYTAHTSNTQRYRMIGNGWTVDIIVQLLRGLRYVVPIDYTK